MTEAVFVALLGNQHGGLKLAILHTNVHLTRLDIELLNRQAADAVFTGKFNDCVPRKQRGGGVGGGHTVAGVAANGTDVPYLRAAHLIHSLPQDIDVFLNQRSLRDMGKAGKRTDSQRSVLLHGNTPEGVNAVNGDQLRAGPLALPHLHQHIAAAGNDLGLRVL